jgi:hypothetical protein
MRLRGKDEEKRGREKGWMIEMRAKGKDEEIVGRGKGIDDRNGVGGWIKK